MCCSSYQYLVTERKEARPQKLYKLMCMQAHEQKINESVILLALAIYQQIKGKKARQMWNIWLIQRCLQELMTYLLWTISYYLWTISMSTRIPSSWALSIRDFRSSGVPQRLLGAKKLVTWYLHHKNRKFQDHFWRT